MLCLALGAVSNVLTAWGFAAWGGAGAAMLVEAPEWAAFSDGDPYMMARGRGVRVWCALDASDVLIESGWPIANLRAGPIRQGFDDRFSRRLGAPLPSALAGRDWLWIDRRVPLAPDALFTPINTLLHAVTWGVLLQMRWRRRAMEIRSLASGRLSGVGACSAFVIIGIGVAILIAWITLVRTPRFVALNPFAERRTSEWIVPVPDDWPITPQSTIQTRGRTLRLMRQSCQIGTGLPSRFGAAIRVDAGWPLPCLRMEWCIALNGALGRPLGDAPPPPDADWRAGVPTPSILTMAPGAHPDIVRVPVRPLLLPLALNVVFYIGVGWIAVGAARDVVAWRRRRGGRCEACGYDVRGIVLCPECGRASG